VKLASRWILLVSLAWAFPFSLSAETQAPPPNPIQESKKPNADIAWYGENQGLPEVEALKRPVLEIKSKAFKTWNFPVGSAVYTLTGQAAYIRVSGTIRGFYFRGDGEWSYASSDPQEFSAIRYILKRHSFVKPQPRDSKLAIQEKVHEALFWFAGGETPQIPGQDSEDLTKAFTVRLEEFIDQDQNAFLHDLALRVLGGTNKPYARIQLSCPHRNWVHVLDGLDRETLSVGFIRKGAWGYLRPLVLVSSQSSQWSNQAPKPPDVLLKHVDLELAAGTGTLARLRVTETLESRREGMKVMALRLRSRMRGSDWSGKEIIQRTRVTAVRDAQGRAVPFDHSSDGLLIAPPGLKANEPVVLTFEIEGDLLSSRASSKSSEGWTLGGWAWFPEPLDDAGHRYTVHALVQASKKFNLIMGGKTLRRIQDDEKSLLETQVERPVHGFPIAATQLACHEDRSGKVLLRTYGKGPEADNPNLRARLQSLLAFYEQLLGPFPFPELNIIIGGSGGNLAPGIITVGPSNQLASYPIEWMAKAIAQQYWNQIVMPWTAEDDWIPGAFSRYCGTLALRSNSEQGRKVFENLLDDLYTDAKLPAEELSIAMASRVVSEDKDPLEILWSSHLAHARGACLVHWMNREIGDSSFVGFMRKLLTASSSQPLTTSQLQMGLKAVTGKDYAEFFKLHFWGPQTPQRLK